MGIFDNIKNAEGGSGGKYIPPEFRGTLECVACKLIISKKPGKIGKKAFVMEGRVDSSSTHEDMVGTTLTFYANLDDGWGFGLADTRACLAGLAGVPETEITDEMAAAACGVDADDQPIPDDGGKLLAGHKVKVETQGATNKNGGAFTKHFFYPAD